MAATSARAEAYKKSRMINPHPCPTLSLRAAPRDNVLPPIIYVVT